MTVYKVVAFMQDQKKTSKEKIISLISDEIIKTKYGDVGQARNVAKQLKEMAKIDEGLKVKDLSRAGVVIEERENKTAKELLDISVKQANDTLNTLKAEGTGMRGKITIFEEVNGVWKEI